MLGSMNTFLPVLITVVSFCRTQVLTSHKPNFLGSVLIQGLLWVGYALIDNLGMTYWLLTW